MKVFVTTMYRYGSIEAHSYILGVWSNADVALASGNVERLYRGRKYEPVVTEWELNGDEWDKSALLDDECHHEFVLDEEYLDVECCQKCGEVRRMNEGKYF